MQNNYLNEIKNATQYQEDLEADIFKQTAKYQRKFNLKITPGTLGYNDETDAFRHAFMQATLSLIIRET